MTSGEEGVSKCSRKTALSIFFVFELFAFILSLIALISPTWQYVYLENGRTEHHHGLWLDCKRDYSHEYGRNREFYETLYRIDKQQSPFDQFFLPSLDCVYKFDYYIDTEDLYDHNHDENRLQDDANQHLFLGWKIAALAAFGLAALAAATSLLVCICAFCHRTFICAAAVLVSLAAFLSSVGLLVFYIWANYQDNNIIKEDDGVYEQYFGWAFYMQIAGTVLHFLASPLGCIATSVAFTKGKAKLVKIEVVDGDQSTLLNDGSEQFKRSFSAIYKVDSAALRRWEKEYMNKMKTETTSKEMRFKRAASMPNVKKGQRAVQRPPSTAELTRSSSNVFLDARSGIPTATTTSSAGSAQGWLPPLSSASVTPNPALRSALKQPVKRDISQLEDSDVTYEILPCDGGLERGPSQGFDREVDVPRSELVYSSLNVYDKVYEHMDKPFAASPDDYEQPNSIRARNSTYSFADEIGDLRSAARPTTPSRSSPRSSAVIRTPVKCTVIDDVTAVLPATTMATEGRRTEEFTKFAEMSNFKVNISRAAGKSDNTPASYRGIHRPPVPANKPTLTNRSSPLITEKRISEFAVRRRETLDFVPESERLSADEGAGVNINTFDPGTFASREGQRSITNLTFRPSYSESIEAFERPDSTDLSSLNSFLLPNKGKSNPLTKSVLVRNTELLANYVLPPEARYACAMPDEVERSTGSSIVHENETVSESPYAYHKEAQLRLNLFMNGVAPLAASETDRLSTTESWPKESSVTTV